MPRLFIIFGYQISIWSNENGEPIHVHVSKKRPSENSTKLWLCSDGKFIVAHNKSQIPENILAKIIKYLNTNSNYVLNFWKAYMGYEKYFK